MRPHDHAKVFCAAVPPIVPKWQWFAWLVCSLTTVSITNHRCNIGFVISLDFLFKIFQVQIARWKQGAQQWMPFQNLLTSSHPPDVKHCRYVMGNLFQCLSIWNYCCWVYFFCHWKIHWSGNWKWIRCSFKWHCLMRTYTLIACFILQQ